ncbi:hypothetical protein BEWA_029590 [Theileria equi strain WA]|uniref:Uncharacterized protein n=1 Tax=Theileria equi strain WA TaxID=1537102 RepID=L0AYY6_THEEQ|nr:hypothetical protein BEWA_029590 [Theileria equi strain WA]AFZ80109.1 hypothetical protein BEWA_029590 [Theileria equi strain WA]|eukprot:XP_004829775.1 hypothetical protein BEWA_029590 [Theileria equi strain WA]
MQDLKDGAVDPLDVRKDIFRALSESDWEAFHLTFKAPKSPKFSKITLKPREKALFKSGIKSVEQIARWITVPKCVRNKHF